MMGVLKIWLMPGLVWGLVFNIDFIRAFKSAEYWGGMLAYEPLTIFKAKNWRLLAVNGGTKAQISYSKAPSDHISDVNE